MKLIEDSAGESAVKEAIKLLGRTFNCGSKVEVLGGRGEEGGFGNGPILELKRGILVIVSGDSSWMSAMSGLEPLFGPITCGLMLIRTT